MEVTDIESIRKTKELYNRFLYVTGNSPGPLAAYDPHRSLRYLRGVAPKIKFAAQEFSGDNQLALQKIVSEKGLSETLSGLSHKPSIPDRTERELQVGEIICSRPCIHYMLVTVCAKTLVGKNNIEALQLPAVFNFPCIYIGFCEARVNRVRIPP